LLNPQTRLGAPNYSNGMPSANQQRAAARAKLLTDLALSAIRDGKDTVKLDEKTLVSLQLWPRDSSSVPQSLDLFINVAADSSEAIDRGEFEVVVGPNVGSDTAGKSLGRFADLLGPDARDALSVVAHAEASAASGALHAELTYLPQSLRAANVTVRPTSRRYEIAVDLPSSLGPEHTIDLKDLLVGIDNNRFYVRSAILNAQIIPCQSHMLNSMRAPAACRFLSDIARDGIAQLASFDWGPAAAFTYLPRVVVGRVVLRVAQWKIDGAIAEALRDTQTAEEFHATLRPWLAQWRVTRHIYLTAGDNRLLIDLHDPAQIDHVRSEVCAGTVVRTVLLDEVYPSTTQAWLSAPHGKHLPEFVVSLKRNLASKISSRTSGIPASTIVPVAPFTEYPAHIRLQPPGSEWLMVKIYAAPATHDQILAGQLYPFAESALSAAMADGWFFIRYSDPEPHLRLRFHGQPETLMQKLFPEVCRWAGALMKEGLVSKYVFDTYERELDRYGGISATTLAESVFAADSRATCRILQLLTTKALRLDRTLVAMVSLDTLLEGLGLLEPERLEWLRAHTQNRMDLGAEYRTRKETFRLAIGAPAYLRSQFGGETFQEVLDERRFALTAVADGLRKLQSEDPRSEDPGQIYLSFVHMHFNRLHGSDSYGELRHLTLLRRTRESLQHAIPTPRFAIP
jgi:lantibiotic biosynthesis protein